MNITVFKSKGRTNYVCQWTDPITGRKKTRSARTKRKRDTERFAGNLKRELVNGTYYEDIRMTWEAFRKRFDEEYLSTHPESTCRRYRTAFNSLERIINPKMLCSLNEAAISKFQAGMRRLKNAEATIKANLVLLKASLAWAVEQKFIPVAPKIRMPKHAPSMKGRPITLEEFERLIDKVTLLAQRRLLSGYSCSRGCGGPVCKSVKR
ncbi:MAG: phage integrase SAM-like domain-containing protein [Planctomycetaceae bacterium]|nr:phage integrase SAM-like domain-containing protein [Planctomycetaceae bacterium]